MQSSSSMGHSLGFIMKTMAIQLVRLIFSEVHTTLGFPLSLLQNCKCLLHHPVCVYLRDHPCLNEMANI